MTTSQTLTAGVGSMILAVAATVSVVAIASPVAPEPKSEFTNILYPLDGTGAVYLGPPEQVTTEPQPIPSQ
ncbi:hypothetical protein ACX3O0_13845 [Homoserinimonas sp. A447]